MRRGAVFNLKNHLINKHLYLTINLAFIAPGTPFYTPTEPHEGEIAEYLLAGYDMINEARYKILVAHGPP